MFALEPGGTWVAYVAAAAFLIMGGASYRSSWRALRKLPRSKGNLAEERAAGRLTAAEAFTKLIPSREEAERRYPGVLNVAKPRKIKLTWRSYLAIVLAPFYLLFFFLDNVTRESAEFVGVVLIVACALFSLVAVQSSSEKQLLRLGEVTTGRIVCREVVSGGRYASSIIFYAFVDATNRPFIGEGSDGTHQMSEGDPVIVFYKPLDPTRSVVLDGCDFKIKVPSTLQP
jgi:hypothetical protein